MARLGVCVLGLLLGLISCSAAPLPLRQAVDLSGEWEYVRVKDLSLGPPSEGWTKIKVPCALPGIDYERAWFRRDFVIPETMRGQRLVLRFGGVKWNSLVRVNGQNVGGHFGGYEPFEIDITAVARVGETNRLELGCHDWTGVFVDRETDFSVMKQRPTDPRQLPRDKILAPIGGRVAEFGPWDQIKLLSHPAIYVRDLFIKPSVRKRELTLDYTLVNQTNEPAAVRLSAFVEDKGQPLLTLPSREIRVPSQGQTTVTLTAPWANPRYWSHEDPYLYFLVSRLEQQGQLCDELRTRFGFREFWTEGPRFYLNGVRINLRATSWWPELFVTPDYIRQRIRAIKSANAIIFRTHTQPWPEIWYEIADEEGLMMIPEGAVWNDDEAYRINDPRFWENYAAHLRAMIDRDKNKPAVVMWSLENEFYGSRMRQGTPAARELARMGTLVKQWDPTRPILYESDGDPYGVADVFGLHYPHEYPDYTDWPNTAYWMDQPLPATYFFLPTDEQPRQWIWDRRKPLYIGEFLWIPSSDPSWDTVFFGDEAYLDYQRYHVLAKAEAWRMAIQAYRYYEVSGISPWTIVEGGPLDESNAMYMAQRYAMQPIAAYVREYDHNFYGGETIRRTADVYNDVLKPSQLLIRWTLAPVKISGQQTLTLQPGERKELSFTLRLPAVTQREEMSLRLEIERAGRIVFTDAKPISVFPPLRLQAPAPIGLYDPSGRWAKRLGQWGLKTQPVASLQSVPATLKILIIAPEALTPADARPLRIGEKREGVGRLLEYVRAGGNLLVLEQNVYPIGEMPLTLTEHQSTMTFALWPTHPILRGVQPDDLKFWRSDHYVTRSEPPRPLQGGALAIVVSGSRFGLAHAPLQEYRYGQGRLVLCQLRLGERLGVEPIAGVLLQNTLDYLTQAEPATQPTALFCPDAKTRDFLEGLGLQATDITTAPAQADWSHFRLLIACHPLAQLQPQLPQLKAFLQRGGTIVLHGLEPAEEAFLQALAEQPIRLGAYHGPVTKRPNVDHPLSSAFANEDLYWLGQARAAHSWATRPRALEMASAIIQRSLEPQQATAYDYRQMRVAGAYAVLRGEMAVLPSNGSTATVNINIPRNGAYLLGVVAGGTSAAGEWPVGSVSVDGLTIGEFACQKGEFDTYALSAELAAGPHEVVIRFINDRQDMARGEDRNLFVKALLVAPEESSLTIKFLSSPPAIAVAEVGTGRLVLDLVRWEHTSANAEKAARYIAGLLTALGASFVPPGAGALLDLKALQPQPNLAWFKREAGGLYMGTSGYVEGPIECVRTGRYRMRITARGTPAANEFPIIAVAVDGEEAGQIALQSESWITYSLPLTLTEGKHTLRLTFTNDLFQPPEDRNLWIGRIEFNEAEE